jgi:microcystin degradation protein MlrC
MVELADALVAYRTYPHVDMAETGARCLPLLERRLHGEILAKAFRRGDFLVPLPWQCTDLEPSRGLYAEAARLEAQMGLSVSIAMGFPAADTPCCGASILVYGNVAGAVTQVADALAARYAASEAGFAGRLWQPLDAVRHAQSSWHGHPIILADTQDNPGGGGSGDTTGLLAALIEARAQGAVLALVCDPEAAAAAHHAGVGATLPHHALGGRSGPDHVLPLALDLDVLGVGDGRVMATGPFYGGNRMELGPRAALRVRSAPGVTVLVATRRIQAADQAMLSHLGIEPAAARILALKSSVHFRADFAALADEILIVQAPGRVAADPRDLPFRKLRPGLRLAPLA